MRENATELISAVAPAPGSSASSGSGWRAGRVAGGDEGDVDQAVAHRVEGAGRRRRMLGQHLELDPAVGRLLDVGRPARCSTSRVSEVRRADPARHGEHGLRRRRRRGRGRAARAVAQRGEEAEGDAMSSVLQATSNGGRKVYRRPKRSRQYVPCCNAARSCRLRPSSIDLVNPL